MQTKEVVQTQLLIPPTELQCPVSPQAMATYPKHSSLWIFIAEDGSTCMEQSFGHLGQLSWLCPPPSFTPSAVLLGG